MLGLPHYSRAHRFQTRLYLLNIDVDPASISAALVPEIDITGDGTSIPDGDTTPIPGDDTDFGSTTNNGTIVITYTVTNYGGAS